MTDSCRNLAISYARVKSFLLSSTSSQTAGAAIVSTQKIITVHVESSLVFAPWIVSRGIATCQAFISAIVVSMPCQFKVDATSYCI
jgi:hypothetical protein